MRIDKFLWCVRIYKTRSLAGEQVRGGKVWIKDVAVKPSREVKPGEEVTIKRHGFDEVISVIALPKSRLGAKLVPEYITDITPQVQKDKEEFLKMARNVTRHKGLGRPTKKDRRDIDSLFD